MTDNDSQTSLIENTIKNIITLSKIKGIKTSSKTDSKINSKINKAANERDIDKYYQFLKVIIAQLESIGIEQTYIQYFNDLRLRLILPIGIEQDITYINDIDSDLYKTDKFFDHVIDLLNSKLAKNELEKIINARNINDEKHKFTDEAKTVLGLIRNYLKTLSN